MTFFKKIKTPLLTALMIALSLGFVRLLLDEQPAEPLPEYVWQSTLTDGLVDYGDQKYQPDPDVTTLLIGGVDNYGKLDLTADGGGEVDMLMLLVINDRLRTVDILQINRDTMTLIDVLNENDIRIGDATAQIALSHAYGNGGTVSAKNTVAAVENLLYGIDIDEYMFVNMGAVPVINDFFGGVEVEIEDDFSDVDLSLVEGERIRLSGQQALTYLRARKDLNDPTNVNRMERHRVYIAGLLEAVRICVSNAADSTFSLYNSIYDYMVTSFSATEMAALVLQSADYEINEITVPEGSFSETSQLEEFYVDNEKLRQTVIELFYRSVNE